MAPVAGVGVTVPLIAAPVVEPTAAPDWAKAAIGMMARPAAIKPEEANVTTRFMVSILSAGG